MIQPLFTCTLPLHAVPKKNRPMLVRKAQRLLYITNKDYKLFAKQAVWLLKSAGNETSRRQFPLTEEVTACYQFSFGNHRHGDLDGVIASINDVLQDAGIIANDKLITGYINTALRVNGEDSVLIKLFSNADNLIKFV